MLGTNPITVAAPALGTDNFFLDMATTTVAVGKVEMQKRRGLPIPGGWAVDKTGHVSLSFDVLLMHIVASFSSLFLNMALLTRVNLVEQRGTQTVTWR